MNSNIKVREVPLTRQSCFYDEIKASTDFCSDNENM